MSIVVRSEFWNNPIVQCLHTLIKDTNINFRESKNITCDMLFPFANSLAVHVLDASQIDENTLACCDKMTRSFKSLLIIVRVDETSKERYVDFLSKVSRKVSAVTYLPPRNFDVNTAKTIWEIVSNTQIVQRNINNMVEERRRLMMNPSETSKKVITTLVKDSSKREELLNMLSQKSGTLRNTLLKGIPELFEENFLLEPE